jgi:hypothetical protein
MAGAPDHGDRFPGRAAGPAPRRRGPGARPAWAARSAHPSPGSAGPCRSTARTCRRARPAPAGPCPAARPARRPPRSQSGSSVERIWDSSGWPNELSWPKASTATSSPIVSASMRVPHQSCSVATVPDGTPGAAGRTPAAGSGRIRSSPDALAPGRWKHTAHHVHRSSGECHVHLHYQARHQRHRHAARGQGPHRRPRNPDHRRIPRGRADRQASRRGCRVPEDHLRPGARGRSLAAGAEPGHHRSDGGDHRRARHWHEAARARVHPGRSAGQDHRAVADLSPPRHRARDRPGAQNRRIRRHHPGLGRLRSRHQHLRRNLLRRGVGRRLRARRDTSRRCGPGHLPDARHARPVPAPARRCPRPARRLAAVAA